MSSVAAFRLYKSAHAATAMSGYGAKRFGGRWNPPGIAVVYTSSSLALAQLELLVHLTGTMPPTGFESVKLEIPDSLINRTIKLDELQKFSFDWRNYPAHAQLQEIGEEWHSQNESAVLLVPSAVSPSEFNYLINPDHPDFSKIKVHKSKSHDWDERLLDLIKR